MALQYGATTPVPPLRLVQTTWLSPAKSDHLLDVQEWMPIAQGKRAARFVSNRTSGLPSETYYRPGLRSVAAVRESRVRMTTAAKPDNKIGGGSSSGVEGAASSSSAGSSIMSSSTSIPSSHATPRSSELLICVVCYDIQNGWSTTFADHYKLLTLAFVAPAEAGGIQRTTEVFWTPESQEDESEIDHCLTILPYGLDFCGTLQPRLQERLQRSVTITRTQSTPVGKIAAHRLQPLFDDLALQRATDEVNTYNTWTHWAQNFLDLAGDGIDTIYKEQVDGAIHSSLSNIQKYNSYVVFSESSFQSFYRTLIVELLAVGDPLERQFFVGRSCGHDAGGSALSMPSRGGADDQVANSAAPGPKDAGSGPRSISEATITKSSVESTQSLVRAGLDKKVPFIINHGDRVWKLRLDLGVTSTDARLHKEFFCLMRRISKHFVFGTGAPAKTTDSDAGKDTIKQEKIRPHDSIGIVVRDRTDGDDKKFLNAKKVSAALPYAQALGSYAWNSSLVRFVPGTELTAGDLSDLLEAVSALPPALLSEVEEILVDPALCELDCMELQIGNGTTLRFRYFTKEEKQRMEEDNSEPFREFRPLTAEELDSLMSTTQATTTFEAAGGATEQNAGKERTPARSSASASSASSASGFGMMEHEAELDTGQEEEIAAGPPTKKRIIAAPAQEPGGKDGAEITWTGKTKTAAQTTPRHATNQEIPKSSRSARRELGSAPRTAKKAAKWERGDRSRAALAQELDEKCDREARVRIVNTVHKRMAGQIVRKCHVSHRELQDAERAREDRFRTDLRVEMGGKRGKKPGGRVADTTPVGHLRPERNDSDAQVVSGNAEAAPRSANPRTLWLEQRKYESARFDRWAIQWDEYEQMVINALRRSWGFGSTSAATAVNPDQVLQLADFLHRHHISRPDGTAIDAEFERLFPTHEDLLNSLQHIHLHPYDSNARHKGEYTQSFLEEVAGLYGASASSTSPPAPATASAAFYEPKVIAHKVESIVFMSWFILLAMVAVPEASQSKHDNLLAMKSLWYQAVEKKGDGDKMYFEGMLVHVNCSSKNTHFNMI
ncbi:unnamed protein product [Amoebophrya sp. A120]|nr:unnamed protein product [Amoebophrya sp. A120]|eukprot:GSA120T00025146001.1